MKNFSRKLLLSTSLITAAIAFGSPAQAQFPTDPQTTCSLDQATFNGWFGGTAPTQPGAMVNAADSTGFPTNNTRCDFYKWSSQMFLWLTSPTGEGQKYVFDSIDFFDVSAVNSADKRTLISNTADSTNNSFSVRSTKRDDDSSVNAQITGETGQAGGSGTLISQNGSPVYYGVHVNDVYAYFLSAVKNLALPAKNFPTTETEMLEVAAYALSQGVVLPDLHAGPMELKTAWVDVDTVGDPANYVQITAEVPKYKVDPKNQVALLQSGSQTKTLALVGMHIVGSVKGHPELVWATVEHDSNVPDVSYNYTNNKGKLGSYTMPESGTWTFSPSTVPTDTSTYNSETVTTINDNLIATQGNTITTSTVDVQMNPWGSAPSTSTGIKDPDNTAELISLNSDVKSKLPSGDVRSNYFLSGAVWTQHGNLPAYETGGPAFTQIGSLSLANSTMETFEQETATDASVAGEAGCFMCHSVSSKQATNKEGINVSHIYDSIEAIKPKK